MTTKIKIVISYLTLVFILCLIAYIGNNSLSTVAEGVAQLDRQTEFGSAAKNIESILNSGATQVYRFVSYREEKDIQGAHQAVKETRAIIAQARELSRLQESLKILEKLEADTTKLDTLLDAILTNIKTAYTLYTTDVQATAYQMMENLRKVNNDGLRSNNIEMVHSLSPVWENFLITISSTSRYVESRKTEDIEAAFKAFEKLQGSLPALRSSIQLDASIREYGQLVESVKGVEKALDHIRSLNNEVEANLAELNVVLNDISKMVDNLNAIATTAMQGSKNSLHQTEASAEKLLLYVSLGGLLVAIGFAAFIILGLARVLRKVGDFATAISQGDFSQKLTITEKGEVGVMVQAMQKIPVVLESIINNGTILANDILSGKYRQRLDAHSFAGTYGHLAQSVNAVGDAYTSILDGLGTPIMTCNKAKQIIFLNKAAKNAVGGDFVNVSCSSKLNAASCNTGHCFGEKAISSGREVSGEVALCPNNREMTAAVVATPLFDMNKNCVGFMEFLTDLTEIRGQQQIMQKVASEASLIADRVASASEELAAQIDIISNGTVHQRAQVESTASAMTEMNSTVLEVARNAGEAADQGEKTRLKAQEGAILVTNVIDSIGAVNEVAFSLQNNMHDLGKQAESIGEVMNVISDIADQTNLLALNAAIEAARAGEAGRGFAVVADEVRKLAEKSMEATRQVGSSIYAIQGSAQTNIAAVNIAVEKIKEARELTTSSGEALSEIVHFATASSAVVSSIATAAEQQSATSEEINRSVNDINQVVAQTAEGMAQSSDAVQELSRMAQDLRLTMDGLK
jgi:Methyl-accepting chemotaxis protein